MKMRLVSAVLATLMLVTLTGCWNRRELNDLAVVVAIGVDKSEGQYLFSVQVVDPAQVASRKTEGSRTPVTMYKAKGSTLYEAAARLATFMPRQPYWAHAQIYVYGEDVAREGIGRLLDVHERDNEVRSNFYLAVAKGKRAVDIIQIITPLEKMPAKKMYDSLENAADLWGTTVKITRDELISAVASEGKDPVLSGITIFGDEQAGKTQSNLQVIKDRARLKFVEMAVFKKDKLVGWLNEKESQGFNFAQGKIKKTFMNLPCGKNGKLVLELIRTESQMKGQVKRGKPEVNVNVAVEANVAELECEVDLLKEQTITNLNNSLAKQIKEQIRSTITKTQKKYKADIFGFGEVIHRSNPKEWKLLKKNWDQEYVNLTVNVKVDAKIRRLGANTNAPKVR